MDGIRIFFLLILWGLMILFSPQAQEITLYGDAETRMDVLFPGGSGDDRYDSLLNPGNLFGLNDILFTADVTGKLEGASDRGGFALWLSLEKYPVASGLYAAAYGDVNQSWAVAEFTAGQGSSILALDLMRLYYEWYTTDALRMTFGRQSFLTGYGYGWNPMDLANPLKDPSDPDQDLTGVDALSLTLDRGGLLQMKAYVLFHDDESDGLAAEDVKGGAEITLQLPWTEIKLNGLAGASADEAERFPNSAGLGFLTDVMGIGIYGEGAFRESRRAPVPGDAPDYQLVRKDGWVFSGLAGLEYYFPSELAVTLEYFYNGEGLDQAERADYAEALAFFNGTLGAAPAGYYELYRPGYFSRHYLLLNLFYPFYGLSSELNVSVIGSPDSASLSILPEWTILPTGNLEISLSWAGSFSLDDDRYNEAWLYPVNHSLALEAVYHF